jgi:hypothetical protein
VGALSIGITVGSSTPGIASLVMNIVLLLAVVVSGEAGGHCWSFFLPLGFTPCLGDRAML